MWKNSTVDQWESNFRAIIWENSNITQKSRQCLKNEVQQIRSVQLLTRTFNKKKQEVAVAALSHNSDTEYFDLKQYSITRES